MSLAMQRRIFRLTAFCTLFSIAFSTVCALAGAQKPTTFSISKGRILKDGSDFVIHGINVDGPGWRWNRSTVQDIDAIVNLWKFNLIRVNCSIKPRPDGKEKETNDLDSIVKAFTARGIVVVIDPHDHPGEYYQDPPEPGNSPSLTDLVKWEKDIAARYKSNPYVWFEVMSTPGKRDVQTVSEQWKTTHETVVKAIREEATSNIIVCEGAGRGSEDGNDGAFPVATASSALLTYGPNLARQYSNLLFAFHIDQGWAAGETKLNDFLDRLQAQGLAVYISEYGFTDWQDPTPGIDAMFTVCKERNIGRCAVQWVPADRNQLCATDDKSGGWQIDTLDGTKPTNLSWVGDKIWDDNHRIGFLHGPLLDRRGWTATAFATREDNDRHLNQPDEALAPYVDQEDYWISNIEQKPGQWFQVDMGALHTFSRLVIDPRVRFTDYPRGYEIYVSKDGANWGAPVAKNKNNQSVLRISFPEQTARYIKIVQTEKTWHHWVIADFQVFAPLQKTHLPLPTTSNTKEILLEPRGWTASAYPTNWSGVSLPLRLTLPEPPWFETATSNQRQQPGQWFQVDMGEPQRFDKIMLTSGRYINDFPRGYEVYVSSDGADWGKPIAEGRGQPVTIITFPAQETRYVRIVTTRYSHNNWQLGQLRFYRKENGGAGAASLHR